MSSTYGWDQLAATDERHNRLTDGTFEIGAKTARGGKELILTIATEPTTVLMMLDTATLGITAVTRGSTNDEAWDAMNAMRQRVNA